MQTYEEVNQMHGIINRRSPSRVAALVVLSMALSLSVAGEASAAVGMDLSPQQGQAGDLIVVQGTLLAPSPVADPPDLATPPGPAAPSEQVGIYFDGRLVALTQTEWLATFTQVITVPFCAKPGMHIVSAIGLRSQRSSWSGFRVIGSRSFDDICT